LESFIGELGMTLTDSGKGLYEGDTFLSRTVDPDPETGIVYPALKKTSIERLLHYTKRLEVSFIADNFEMVLNESALWDQEYYESIVSDIKTQCKNLDTQYNGLGQRVLATLEIQRYPVIRAMWTAYIMGTSEYPSFTVKGTGLSTQVNEFVPNISIKNKARNKKVKFIKNYTDLIDETTDDQSDYVSLC
jgi:hypothetical protein